MFELVSNYKPSGDQPKAIKELVENIKNGKKEQVLLGATGTGKTFTMANVIKETNKKTLVLAHNKTLAGQLYSELKTFFPNNHVEFFISYYDYYQPEAYVKSKDLYIEKDCDINDDIDQMRHSAVTSLLEYDDVVVVASVSCIYGIGDPSDYKENMIILKEGQKVNMTELLEKLIKMQYTRNDYEIKRGIFKLKGDTLLIIPPYNRDEAIKVEFFDDEIDRIKIVDTLTNKVISQKKIVTITPATLFASSNAKREEALRRIRNELEERIKYFNDNHMPLEAERIKSRTLYDLEMLNEVGYCSGIENYSRHMSLREEGETPYCLIDFFGDDFLLMVDESHVTIPQVRGMYNGDRSRKESLVENGFRLPSALDNRPLKFDEFQEKIKQVVYVSATPAPYELERSGGYTEQIIRPTGLLDPLIEVRPSKGQIDDLIIEIRKRIAKGERVLVVTLTINMSEDLTKYLKELNIKVAYLHSEVKSLERLEIIRALRLGTFDVLVGINLLREGLDLPEVSLIAILDSDKEGFLRSETSLIQIVGRCARNSNGKVIMYADTITKSMEGAINETFRRRMIQEEYNKEHNIVPKTIYKDISTPLVVTTKEDEDNGVIDMMNLGEMSNLEKRKIISDLEIQMKAAAKALDFEQAMSLRDVIFELKASL